MEYSLAIPITMDVFGTEIVLPLDGGIYKEAFNVFKAVFFLGKQLFYLLLFCNKQFMIE